MYLALILPHTLLDVFVFMCFVWLLDCNLLEDRNTA